MELIDLNKYKDKEKEDLSNEIEQLKKDNENSKKFKNKIDELDKLNKQLKNDVKFYKSENSTLVQSNYDLKNTNSDLKIKIADLNKKLLEFLSDLGIEKTPIEFWTNIIYEDAKDFKQLFIDVINNLCEHLNLNDKPEYINGVCISRTLNKSKIGFSIGIQEL